MCPELREGLSESCLMPRLRPPWGVREVAGSMQTSRVGHAETSGQRRRKQVRDSGSIGAPQRGHGATRLALREARVVVAGESGFQQGCSTFKRRNPMLGKPASVSSLHLAAVARMENPPTPNPRLNLSPDTLPLWNVRCSGWAPLHPRPRTQLLPGLLPHSPRRGHTSALAPSHGGPQAP